MALGVLYEFKMLQLMDFSICFKTKNLMLQLTDFSICLQIIFLMLQLMDFSIFLQKKN